ncbi:hypothetical protein VNO77_02653 [Canavalia gladiata]|uniref:Uncharacterized protein n=1 Tax=Canavalia gladiata TaxID=3824 RepID=A0AAN9MTE5_CANGL
MCFGDPTLEALRVTVTAFNPRFDNVIEGWFKFFMDPTSEGDNTKNVAFSLSRNNRRLLSPLSEMGQDYEKGSNENARAFLERI